MGVFEFVLGLAAIVFVLGLVGILSSYKLVTVYLERRSARASQAVDVTGRLDALETRVGMLERIVTDRRSTLKKELEDLGE